MHAPPEDLPPDAARRRDRLLALLGELDGVAVAFSGGVDSAVVAKAAFLALGAKAVAVTADSPSVARADLADARRVAAAIGIRHEVISTREFQNADYLKNDGGRCYFCKSELYSQVGAALPRLGVGAVVSGANLDDLGDYRPGLVAAAEHAVRHPLQEAGFAKGDVRELARHWGLAVADKPASPCLSSRLAPGLAVTAERTGRVEAAERYLRGLGLSDCRVRHHEGDLARVEVPAADIARFAAESARGELAAALLALGFRYVTLDLVGLRSGSLNDLVSLEVKARYAPANGTVGGPRTR